MNHEEYKEMLVIAALGALDTNEEMALAAHLSECPSCRAERRELEDAAALLAHAAPPVAPSPQLRAHILSQISGGVVPHHNPDAADEGAAASSVREKMREEKPSASRERGSSLLLFSSERQKRGFVAVHRNALAAAAIAASLVILALSVALATLWTRNNQLTAELARLSARTRETEQQLAETRREFARQLEVAEVLSAPEAQVTMLAGTEAAPRAHAAFTYDRRTGRAVLYTSGLPPAPAGKAYQLWFIAGGRPLPGGVFTPDAQGRATLHEQMPPAGLDAQTFAVTLEPAGGTPAPTGGKFLVGSTSS